MTRDVDASGWGLVAILAILVAILAVAFLLGPSSGCTVNMQVGPDHWPGASTTQPSEIEKKIWEDFE